MSSGGRLSTASVYVTCTRQRDGVAYGSDCARSSVKRNSGNDQVPSTSWYAA